MSRQAQRNAAQTGAVARIALALERIALRPPFPMAQPFLILAGQVNVSHIGCRIEISNRGSLASEDRHCYSTAGILRGFTPVSLEVGGGHPDARSFIIGIGAAQQTITVDVNSKVMIARGLQ